MSRPRPPMTKQRTQYGVLMARGTVTLCSSGHAGRQRQDLVQERDPGGGAGGHDQAGRGDHPDLDAGAAWSAREHDLLRPPAEWAQ